MLKLLPNYIITTIYKSTLTLQYPYTINCTLPWTEHHIYNFNADKPYKFAICDRQTGTLYGAIALSNNQRFEMYNKEKLLFTEEVNHGS